MILANVIQSAFSPLIWLFLQILARRARRSIGGSWGWSIIGLTLIVRDADVPADAQPVQGHGEDARCTRPR